ncbi:Nucleolar protein 16 [Fasciola hepatica]|uniref:Nucleolar protein 16 n=1 Tax=Fasciola hepatica TaxID=6192 RepID=A0A4E0RCB6_FASHE|nr:Nucleolar protein 16 [Fasciola hepatica]
MGKKKGFSYSRNLKKRRQKEKGKLKIRNPIINSAWKHGQSMKSNFSRMGIAHDPNEVLKIPSRAVYVTSVTLCIISFSKGKQKRLLKFGSELEWLKVKFFSKFYPPSITALEEAAKHSKKKSAYFSDDDGLFCIYNLETHGSDFVKMARDPRNVYQHTPKQLERLIEKFKKTTGYVQYMERKQAGTFDITAIFEIAMA